jgi:hypothetical protein
MKLDYQIVSGGVAIAFDEVPPGAIRAQLKAHGYKFDGKAWHKSKVAGSAELVRWIRAELDKHNAAAPVLSPDIPPAPPAIAEQSPPLAPQAPEPFTLRTDSPRPKPAPAPSGPKPKQLAMFRGLNDSPGQAELWGDLESYGRRQDANCPDPNPSQELQEMTARARELAAEQNRMVYITRNLASGEWHLRRSNVERGEHENLMRVVFANGRYSD